MYHHCCWSQHHTVPLRPLGYVTVSVTDFVEFIKREITKSIASDFFLCVNGPAAFQTVTVFLFQSTDSLVLRVLLRVAPSHLRLGLWLTGNGFPRPPSVLYLRFPELGSMGDRSCRCLFRYSWILYRSQECDVPSLPRENLGLFGRFVEDRRCYE